MKTTGARVVLWCLIIVAGALLLLTSFYLDSEVQAWLAKHQVGGLRNFMRGVSRFGDWPEHIALAVVLLGIARWRNNRKWMQIAMAMILACAIAGTVARVVKVSTGRARPYVQATGAWSGPSISSRYNAFPSGHTAASTAFFTALAFSSWRNGVPLLLVPLLIGFSRMYVTAHHLSDVVCAMLIGLLVGYLVATWLPRIQNRKSQPEN